MGKVKFPGLLLALAGIFASFLLGLFVGRRTGGEILYIQQERPAVSQALSMETAPPVDNVPTEAQGRINVNTAGVEELSQLPGIGEVLAGRIVAYREENGSFLSTQELQNVEGIGEKRLDAILDLITVGG